MKVLLSWILFSVALAIGISLVALLFDFLAERWSKQEKPRRIVRSILLIESSEKIADSIDRMNFQQIAIWGGLVFVAFFGVYFLAPLVGSIVVGTVFRNLGWIIIVVVVLAVLYARQRVA
jgi:hypothetical protein